MQTKTPDMSTQHRDLTDTLGIETFSLTKDNQDEEQGGHARRDEEHVSDVVRQLLLVVHVGHQYGRHQEPDGDAQLQENGA